MSRGGTILVVDDEPANRKLLGDLLEAHGYAAVFAAGGEEALAIVRASKPDLLLLDVVMPDKSGYDVCRAMRKDAATQMLPVVMVTALDANEERIRGLEAGADDFLTKPVNRPELLARVSSLLRIKHLYDTVQAQAAELSLLNASLEGRVREQLGQLERLGQLKRFFPPHLAEMIVSGDMDDPLRTRRREVTVAMLDLRGFNAFADTSEPEEVMGLLHGYHQEMGALIEAHGGTLEQFGGRAMMVVFNDPVVVDDAPVRAVRLAMDMQRVFGRLLSAWKKRGHEIELGIGIAQGYATIGSIGDERRASYGVIGRVVNVASRLCTEAPAGQVLVSEPVRAQIESRFAMEEAQGVSMAGFARPIRAFRVVGETGGAAVEAAGGLPVRICTLGRFAIEIGGRPLEYSRKTQKKPLDMLKALIAHGCTRVESGTLTEALWPGAEGDAGKMSFDSNLHRLRRLIGLEDLLTMSEGRLSLDVTRCWVDVRALDDLVVRAEQSAVASNGEVDSTLARNLLQIYAGHFLDNETQDPWAVAARDRYKSKFVRAVSAMADVLESRREWEKAAELYARVLELDNLAEAFYRRLMVCYRELGEPAEALNAYRRCREMLSIVLGLSPSPETEAVRVSLGQVRAFPGPPPATGR